MIANHSIYQGNYYRARSKPPLAQDFVFIRPSRDVLGVKKLYDVVFKLLFVSIALTTLLAGTAADTVFSLNSTK